MKGADFAYIHLEAPDEMSHQGSLERKLKAIENLDARIVKPVYEAMEVSGEPYRLLILPDHPTPLRIRTHSSDPVPYLLYDSRKNLDSKRLYGERAARESGIFREKGYQMMRYFLEAE